MTSDALRTCDVCGAQAKTRIASSSLGPVSFAYCARCLERDAEPLMVVVAAIFAAGGPEQGDLADLASTVTFVDHKYVGLDIVLQNYSELEDVVQDVVREALLFG